mmetsp:Transcript_14387/g.16081  ORF Transcript_14387/g.16081 Transcript_14387/m.16081 type:complete len:188 (+) Transcript_14387:61-624(+)
MALRGMLLAALIECVFRLVPALIAFRALSTWPDASSSQKLAPKCERVWMFLVVSVAVAMSQLVCTGGLQMWYQAKAKDPAQGFANFTNNPLRPLFSCSSLFDLVWAILGWAWVFGLPRGLCDCDTLVWAKALCLYNLVSLPFACCCLRPVLGSLGVMDPLAREELLPVPAQDCGRGYGSVTKVVPAQ